MSYMDDLTSLYTPEEEYAGLDLAMPDDKLGRQLRDSLTKSRQHWNEFPWRLEQTDKRAVQFLFPQYGATADPNNLLARLTKEDEERDDNVLFESWRAILSYATGQLGVPELTPSRSDDQAKRTAANMGKVLYQHSLDEDVEFKVRSMAGNVIDRKRGFLKVRWDGELEDIITDVVAPEDLIIDRFAGFMTDPNAIHHRMHASVDELCSKYSKQATKIYQLFGINKGVYTQMSKMVPYFETWFSYVDAGHKKHQGVATWLESPSFLMLDKMLNPNWIYTGSNDKDKQQNFLKFPPKPFVGINYLNTGKSAIDETCLFEQAIGTQKQLNARNNQWHKNIDLVNGRWLYDKTKMEEAEATRFVNKGGKSLLGVDPKGAGLSTAMEYLGANALGPEVYESIADLRQRIKDKMGTPNQFQGQDSGKQNTLGHDLLVKQQAGSLQDDFVHSIQKMYGNYYSLKLQLFLVNFTEDRTFMVKSKGSDHTEITLGPDTFDSNVKVGVKADSTLPLDKASIRQTSANLLSANKIDLLNAYRDLGYPDAEERAEATLRSQLDPMGYLNSVVQGIEQDDARDDIDAVINGKDPKERDSYDQKYLDAYNLFLTTNEFAKLNVKVKKDIVAHLALVQHIASQQASLQEAMLDDAGISEAPIQPPMPKKTIQIKGQLDPADSAQEAGLQAPQSPPGVPPSSTPPGINPMR